MSSRRRAAQPPELEGFTFVELIGSGGFADVFLYEQLSPRRRVAVKVMHTDRMSERALAEFTAEGDAMALLSSHPSIVTIYATGQAADGRPYLVMEYAPRPNLQVRYRAAAFSVAETLRVGVQISAAVETAHRAGIMHRDIKPANILVTDYNHAALTDFGIASTSIAETSSGLSIPWSAPELFAERPFGGPEADVYAIAATLYTLLAGHSPFEGPDPASSIELIDRIERSPVPPLRRQDVPESLSQTLVRAMAKQPKDRYPSAAQFARALQRVQIELGHSVTPIDIIDDAPDRRIEDGETDGLTRIRSITNITPAAGDATPTPVPSEPEQLPAPQDVEPRKVRRRKAAPSLQATRGPWSTRRGRRWMAVALAVAVVVTATASVLVALARPSETPVADRTPQDIVAFAVPSPIDLAGEVSGSEARFRWTNPDPQDGDSSLWRYVGVGLDERFHRVEAMEADVPLSDQPMTCIEVVIRRADGRVSATPAQACVP